MKRLLLQLLVMLAGMMLFFIDMKHEPGSAVYQLYGFAHLAFFMLMALGLSRLPDLARRPFLFQFALIVFVVLFVGGIIEVIQPYFGRTASWRDLGIDLLGALLGVMFLAPARRSLGRGLLAFGQFAVVAVGIMVFYGPIVTLWDMRQASRKFPMLGDFETRLETRRWSSGEIDKGIARHGESSLRVSLGTGKYDATDSHRQYGQDSPQLNRPACNGNSTGQARLSGSVSEL